MPKATDGPPATPGEGEGVNPDEGQEGGSEGTPGTGEAPVVDTGEVCPPKEPEGVVEAVGQTLDQIEVLGQVLEQIENRLSSLEEGRVWIEDTFRRVKGWLPVALPPPPTHE